MGQSRDDHFERAISERNLGVLGDPERWGSTVELVTRIVNKDPVERYSEQIFRVQCQDLVARSWDLLVRWTIVNLDDFDNILRCSLIIQVGVGQTNCQIALDLTACLNQYPTGGIAPPPTNGALTPAIPWEVVLWGPGYTDGTVLLPTPIPAVALSGRLVLTVQNSGNPITGAVKPHRIATSVFAAVSPRALA